MEITTFTMDDSPEFEAYDTGRRWNGFACPSFTREQADKLVEYWNSLPGFKAWYDAEHNGYAFDSEDWDEPDLFLPEYTIGEDPQAPTRWEIGAGCWTWNRTDDFE